MRQSRKGYMFTKHKASTVLEFGGLAFFGTAVVFRSRNVRRRICQRGRSFLDKLTLKVWQILTVKQELKNKLTNNLNLHI